MPSSNRPWSERPCFDLALPQVSLFLPLYRLHEVSQSGKRLAIGLKRTSEQKAKGGVFCSLATITRNNLAYNLGSEQSNPAL